MTKLSPFACLVLLQLSLGVAGFSSSRCTYAVAKPHSLNTHSALFRAQNKRIEEPIINNRHSASDWFYNVKSIFQSEILREVRGPVVAVAVWSAALSVIYRVLSPTAAAHLSIPGTAHSFLVSAIGLLLVFRTNSAYQRFYVSFESNKIRVCSPRNSPRCIR
jgi:hypothetical protein